jgi:hypothetical protein
MNRTTDEPLSQGVEAVAVGGSCHRGSSPTRIAARASAITHASPLSGPAPALAA